MAKLELQDGGATSHKTTRSNEITFQLIGLSDFHIEENILLVAVFLEDLQRDEFPAAWTKQNTAKSYNLVSASSDWLKARVINKLFQCCLNSPLNWLFWGSLHRKLFGLDALRLQFGANGVQPVWSADSMKNSSFFIPFCLFTAMAIKSSGLHIDF